MKSGRFRWMALCTTVLVATAIGAQEPGQPGKQTSQSADTKQTMSIDDMMKGCRDHCMKTSQTIDQLLATMERARQSNAPAQMRSALEQSQKPLKEMKEHMSGCMGMMDMMQHMHRGGMMKSEPKGSTQDRPEGQ